MDALGVHAHDDSISDVRPLRTTADVCDVIGDLMVELVDDEVELLERIRAAAPERLTGFGRGQGFEPRGGPTNRRHNFTTGEDNPVDGSGDLVPQHSDPVGEQVVAGDERARTERDELQSHLRGGYEAALRAMRELETARSCFARSRRSERMDAQRSRENCWPCLDLGVHSEVYRDSAPKLVGQTTPRCRKHYDFFVVYLFEAPEQLGVWWSEGRRVTSTMLEPLLAERRARRKSKTKKRRR
jgi:hypothetical protein